MVQLDRLGEGLAGQVCVKLEYFNPGGSVKDRIGVAMIDAAEQEGLIEPGKSVIVEPTAAIPASLWRWSARPGAMS